MFICLLPPLTLYPLTIVSELRMSWPLPVWLSFPSSALVLYTAVFYSSAIANGDYCDGSDLHLQSSSADCAPRRQNPRPLCTKCLLYLRVFNMCSYLMYKKKRILYGMCPGSHSFHAPAALLPCLFTTTAPVPLPLPMVATPMAVSSLPSSFSSCWASLVCALAPSLLNGQCALKIYFPYQCFFAIAYLKNFSSIHSLSRKVP